MASCKRDLFTFCLFLLSCILAHIKCERPNVNGDKVATRIRGNDVELSSDNSCLPDSDTAVNGSVTDHADGVTVSCGDLKFSECLIRPDVVWRENLTSISLESFRIDLGTSVTVVAENTSKIETPFEFILSWEVERSNSGEISYIVNTRERDVGLDRYSGGTCGNYTALPDQLLFQYDCQDTNFTIKPRSEHYTISLYSIPEGLQGLIFTRVRQEDVAAIENAETLHEWYTVVAIVMLNTSKQPNGEKAVQVIFQPVPQHLYEHVDHYAVIFIPEGGLDLSRCIPKNGPYEWEIHFPHVSLNLFHATVMVYGVENTTCNPHPCIAGNTTDALFRGFEYDMTTPAEHTLPPTLPHTENTTQKMPPDEYSTDDSSAKETSASADVVHPLGEDGTSKTPAIAGTISAVFFIALVTTITCCILRRRKAKGIFQRHRLQDEAGTALDVRTKQPSVLIVYSYDCSAHEQVVVEFANFIKYIFRCEVNIDIWVQHEIQVGGATDWLQAKLDQSQYIIIICSTGARFKCVKKQQNRLKQNRAVPDVFTSAVDYVSESMRLSQSNEEALRKFVVVYFDYSSPSDVPPKLDRVTRFCLMSDLFFLYCHLHGLRPEESGHLASHYSIQPETFHCTDIGRQMYEALTIAHDFFENNPNWLEFILEQNTPSPIIGSSDNKKDNSQINSPSTERREISPNQRNNFGLNGMTQNKMNGSPSTTLSSEPVSSSSPSIVSDEEALLDNKYCKYDTEGIGNGKNSPKSGITKWNGVSTLDSPASSNSSSSDIKQMNVNLNMSPRKATEKGKSQGFVNPLYVKENGMDTDDCYLDNDEQIQRDIEFITNFDARRQVSNGNTHRNSLFPVRIQNGEFINPLSNENF